ncbi:hypothetical protein BD309DRAFT_933489 [Dichomitus squalens]|nr:hypothetical protein BD309DRAFT_933489 [Dichomitus squalens]
MSRPFRIFAYRGVVYTVVNPSLIQVLPPIAHGDPEVSMTARSMRRPQWAVTNGPEIAYMPKSDLADNRLLARLNCDARKVALVRAQSGDGRQGFMLNPELQKSWRSLENSLLYIWNKLEAAIPRSAEFAFPMDVFWGLPSTFGYCHVHFSDARARVAIAKSRDACLVLAARCTLAIALISTDSNTEPPRWFRVLADQNVPPVWLDMLRDAGIADLSPGVRAGAYINMWPSHSATPWIGHVPCMIRANVPVYIAWPHAEMPAVLAAHPYLSQYAPTSSSQVVAVPDLGVDHQIYFEWSEVEHPGLPTAPTHSDSDLFGHHDV